MKYLFAAALVVILGDSTKVDTAKVRIDSTLYIVTQQAQFFKLYQEQKTQIDSIKKKLNDPKIIKKLRKKLKK